MLDKNAIIICGWAGIGKSTLQKKYKNAIDLESITYKWDYDKKLLKQFNHEQLKALKTRKINPNWPANYLSDINKSIKQYDIILVAYSRYIIDLLVKNNYDFYLCYPDYQFKDEYIERYLTRGNNENYLNTIKTEFETEFNYLSSLPFKKLNIFKGEFLEDVLIRENIPLIKK